MILDGKEYTLDLMRISRRDFFTIFRPETTAEAQAEVVARAWGLTVDEFMDLPYPHSFALNVEFIKSAKNPLESPNSVSGSTTG